MHTIEEKRQFILLRVQGWSINKIAKHINVPKATVWRWDHDDREQLQILKAVRFEELQEKFVPTYEEELEQLSAYRDRIRKALEKYDFSTMKPEFLLQMDLQISSRLAKFRANVGLHAVSDPEPAVIPGCVSRTEVPYTGIQPDDDPTVAAPAPAASSTPAAAPEPEPSPIHHSVVTPHSENGPFRDKTPPGSKRDDSASTTSEHKNGPVPFSEVIERAKALSDKLASAAKNGHASPPPSSTAPREAGSGKGKQRVGPEPEPSPIDHSSLVTTHSENGPFRDKTPRGSKRDRSASTTSEHKNGPVPFSEATEQAKARSAKLTSAAKNGHASPPRSSSPVSQSEPIPFSASEIDTKPELAEANAAATTVR